jgi:LuxR family maltose regulon positive regulatory protein
VVDDVHLLTNPSCIDAFRFFLEQLPPRCHLVLASRTDPPLGLARLRARGQLSELRAADLSFTPDEAESYLNGVRQLNLTATSVAQLEARTEGWAAGLYLAALSLRNHPDPQHFVATFAGQHRHLVDYLGVEVLEHLADADRTFLIQTAILEQLSGPLCDALLATSNAAQRLRALAQQNLFIFPLDEQWQWYRYHPLFRDLLLAELTRRFPDRIAALHQRAAVWYAAADDAGSAMQHALVAEDEQLIGDLFLTYAQPLLLQGRLATVSTWLAVLPEATIAGRPALALATAWAAALTSAPPIEVTRRLALAEDGARTEPFFLGEPSLAAALSLARARWVVDDVGAAVADAEAAAVACSDPGTPAYMLARAALGRALILAGRPAEARAPLEAALRGPLAERQVQAASRTLATLALANVALGEEARAGELARRAVEQVAERDLAGAPNLWLIHAVLGQVLIREGRLEDAATILGVGVEPQLGWLRAWRVMFAAALLPLAALYAAQGLVPEARARLATAQAAVRGCRDAGILPRLIAEAERGLGRLPPRSAGLREALSEGELRVLRLLSTHLTQREIGRELYLSVNTVKSHIRAIYGKLDAGSRSEAVARARSLHLVA